MMNQKSMGQKSNSGQRTKFYLEQFEPESSKHLKILIAKFLDKKGVIPWKDSMGCWIRPSELSQLDRQQLVQTFVSSRLKVSTMEELEALGFKLAEPLTFDQFLLELEKHIDLKLPLHYFAYLNQQPLGSKSKAKKMYPGVDYLQGFTFKYRVNYILDLRYVEKLKIQREADQLKQLREQARQLNLTLKRHTLAAEEVKELLEAMSRQRLSESQLKTYFVNNDPYYSQAQLEFDEFYA